MENINYNEDDEELRGLIKALNESGYKTKFLALALTMIESHFLILFSMKL